MPNAKRTPPMKRPGARHRADGEPARTPPLCAGDVDHLLERLFAAPSVDVGQVPMHVARRLDSGETRLALAVLEDALRCALRHHGSPIRAQRAAADDALLWMRSEDDAPPFSYVRICQLFHLDPDWLREAVGRRLRQGHSPATVVAALGSAA